MVRLLHNFLLPSLVSIFFVFTFSNNVKAGRDIVYKNPIDSIITSYSFLSNSITNDGGKLVSKLYPNPASSYVIIDFEKNLPNNTHLLVYSFTGSKMSDVIISNLRVELNLGNYYRGLYLYQLVSSTGKILESGKFQVIK